MSNGGLWQITRDNLFNSPFGGLPMTRTNSGTLRKSAGSGLSQINEFNFVNQTPVLIQSDIGILQFSTPITNSAGTLRVNGGTNHSGRPYSLTGGTLEGTGAFGPNTIPGDIVSPG